MKRALITGITGGLGSELAKALWMKDWQIYGVSRVLDERAEKLISCCKSPNRTLEIKPCDLGNAADLEELAPWWNSLAPELDAFIHLAAPRLDLLPFWRETNDSFRDHLNIGICSATRICRDLVRPMSKRGNCHMLFILSSTTLGKASKGMSSYTIGKYALLGLANTLRAEYSPQISIHCISPSVLDTSFLDKLSPAVKKILVDASEEKIFTPIEKVVEKILFCLDKKPLPEDPLNLPV
jgi:NAD(P)-dependent dehydrogenase (short-subunit alcohol dehydrogenase family)